MIDIVDEIEVAFPEHLVKGDFDLIIVGASWDQRSLVALKFKDVRAQLGLIIKYKDTGPAQGAKKVGYKLMEGLKTTCKECEELPIDSSDPVGSWNDFRNKVVELVVQSGRILRIAIDLATVPRFITLGLLGYVSQTGFASKIVYWYSIGSYCNISFSEREGGVHFAGGLGRVRPVPAIGRPTAGDRLQHLLVSAGFDGAATSGLVADLEPSSVSLLYCNDPSHPEYYNRALTENRSLIRDFLIPEKHITHRPMMPISKIIGVVKQEIDSYPQQELSVLIAGPKMHALGLAIAATVLDVKGLYFGVHSIRNAVSVDNPTRFYAVTVRPLGV